MFYSSLSHSKYPTEEERKETKIKKSSGTKKKAEKELLSQIQTQYIHCSVGKNPQIKIRGVITLICILYSQTEYPLLPSHKEIPRKRVNWKRTNNAFDLLIGQRRKERKYA